MLLLDLYRISTYLQSVGFSIEYITDLDEPDEDLASSTAHRDIVSNEDLMAFSKKVPRVLSVHHAIASASRGYDVIYYSGHGKCGSFLLPDAQCISIYTLICMNPRIIILDCCEPSRMSLRYQLIGERFLPSSDNFSFYPQLLLCSSEQTGQSHSSRRYGSFFTTALCQALEAVREGQSDAKLSTLLTSIRGQSKYNKRAAIYSAMPVLPLVPSLLYMRGTIEIDQENLKLVVT